MNLRGKTREQIEQKVANLSRSELIDIIYSCVTVEHLLKPSEISSRCALNRRSILRDLKNGLFGPYVVYADNAFRVPVSGVNRWLKRFIVPANGKNQDRALNASARNG